MLQFQYTVALHYITEEKQVECKFRDREEAIHFAETAVGHNLYVTATIKVERVTEND